MKPENRFIAKVHKGLNPDVEREKTFNPLRGGTPDCNYAGFMDELWIEYKYTKSERPLRWKPDLSPLQLAWLVKRHDRGRAPWVVIGNPTGCVILTEPVQWTKGVGRDEAQVLSVAELQRRIELRCGLEHSPGSPPARGTSTP